MRDGGDILALGANIRKAMAQITADLPIGIEPSLVADQPVVVDQAIREFMVSLMQAIGIIMAVSFISLGVRPGLIIALAIPFTLAIVFPIMGLPSIDMQRISLGALIIALALLVDDAMTTTDATLSRLGGGRQQDRGRNFRISDPCNGDARGHAGDDSGFYTGGLCGEFGRRIHVFALRRGHDRTSGFLVRCGHFHATAREQSILVPPKKTSTSDPGRIFRMYRSFLTFAMRAKWLTIADLLGALRLLRFLRCH